MTAEALRDVHDATGTNDDEEGAPFVIRHSDFVISPCPGASVTHGKTAFF
jgi:hypothetical protein